MLDRLGVPGLPFPREVSASSQLDPNLSQRMTFRLQLPCFEYGVLFFGIGFEVDAIGRELVAVRDLTPGLFLLIPLAAQGCLGAHADERPLWWQSVRPWLP